MPQQIVGQRIFPEQPYPFSSQHIGFKHRYLVAFPPESETVFPKLSIFIRNHRHQNHPRFHIFHTGTSAFHPVTPNRHPTRTERMHGNETLPFLANRHKHPILSEIICRHVALIPISIEDGLFQPAEAGTIHFTFRAQVLPVAPCL